MNFQAYCFKCEKSVTAYSILDEGEFWSAMGKDEEIEVMHVAEDGDHRWKLNEHERGKLRRDRAKGLI